MARHEESAGDDQKEGTTLGMMVVFPSNASEDTRQERKRGGVCGRK